MRPNILFLVLILTAYMLMPVAAHSAWMDPAWGKRSGVTIANPGGTALSNFQVRLSLGTSFDFATAKADGSDLRFAGADGTTPIPFWIESWNPSGKSASIWINIPSIPSSGTTVYLYYGNPAAATASDGAGTFEFFDDFEPGTAPGYYGLGNPQTVLVQDQAWENSAPHTLSVLPGDGANPAYRGYYGLQGCGGAVGLAFSNDLTSWTKYAGNPLITNARWPSVQKIGNTTYMVFTRDFCIGSYLKLAASTDGVSFNDLKTVVPAQPGTVNQNPNLFHDPNDGKYYLYWYHGDDASFWEIRARSASTPEGLDDPSTEVVVLRSSKVLAAPNMLYRDGTYFLSAEILDATGQWATNIYSSKAPTTGFVPLPGNPVLANGSACNFQHVLGTTLHDYYCKATNVWTIEHRSADLTAGRVQAPFTVPNPGKWTPSGGSWSGVSATQANGSTGGVLQGGIGTSAVESLLSSYGGTDYVLEAQGRLLQGRAWGLGVRALDNSHLYSGTLYEDLDLTNNLYLYNWTGTAQAQMLGSAAVGPVAFGTWYKLSIRAHGSALEVFLDDALKLKTTSSQYASGAAALFGEQGTVVQFDNALVRRYAAAEPVAALEGEVALVSVTLNPSSVNGGDPSQGTLTLSAPAPSGGVVIALSDDSAAVQVPSSVTVPAGSSSATFAISTTAATSDSLVNVSAAYGGVTRTASLTVVGVHPVPVTTGLVPASVSAGSAGGTLTVNGSGFIAGSVVRWNGAARSTTYVSATQLWAAIPASDAAVAGSYPVTVVNPAPGGGTSNAQVFTVLGASNPVPVTTSMVPTSVSAGAPGGVLTVNGSGFIAGSVVNWNGAPRSTTYVSATQLLAVIPPSDAAVAGSFPVTVVNPAPGGGASNAQIFTITSATNPVPVTSALIPTNVPAGGNGGVLTVNGSGFVGGSVVYWNGSPRATTYVSASVLAAVIPATDAAVAGSFAVTVVNPGPGGGTSNAQVFTINPNTNPVPVTTSLVPAGVPAGGNGGILTVNGSGFVTGSLVYWNGSPRATTYVSASVLTAVIPASDAALAGSYPVTVVNPAPGGGTSNAQTFTLN